MGRREGVAGTRHPRGHASAAPVGAVPGIAANLVRRLAAGEIYRAFGRFHLLRRGYSLFEGQRQQLFDGRPSGFPRAGGVALPPGDPVETIRREGVCTGLRLSAPLVGQIAAFAETAPCTRPGFGECFSRAEVVDGRLADGRPVPIADLREPAACPAVSLVASDGALQEAIRRYLGYRPRRIVARLWWSFVCSLPDGMRRSLGQTIDFHYDIVGYNAAYAYFYLRDTDRLSGAHVTMRRSHRRKPLGMLLSTASKPDEAIRRHYGAENELIVEGPAGTGFLEDPASYHKALAPVARERLVLQIRFS